MGGEIHGIKVCKGAPSFSHLLFAEDFFFLFCRANDTKISIVKEILHIHGLASGQLINHEKLEIFSAPILPNTRGATSQPSL